MDDDTVDLLRQLLTRAGMIMEDVCAAAVAPPRDLNGISAAAKELSAALERAAHIVAAANALIISE